MTSKNVHDDDVLNRLPEEIFTQILSLMPTKFAVRTSILSKRWRYSWTFITNLDFDDMHMHPLYCYHSLSKFVDRVLTFCEASQVKLFRLHFSKFRACKSSVSDWIDKAVRLNVCELDMHVIQLKLPVSFFTCKTITKLRLDLGDLDHEIRERPCQVNLPCLKTLDIIVIFNSIDFAFELISGCPRLEVLSLETLSYGNVVDYVFNIRTLKRLKLTILGTSLGNRLVLNVPNLEYLSFGGDQCTNIVMESVASLVEASFSFREIISFHLWFKLLKGISGVKSLSIQKVPEIELGQFQDFPSLNFLSSSRMAKFPNLEHLELKKTFSDSRMLLQFLENSPMLKHLHIEKLEVSLWTEPEVVPACMLKKLTTVKFSNCKAWKFDIPLLKYMLRYAEVLKTLTITLEDSRFEEINEEEEEEDDEEDEEEIWLRVDLLKLLPMASRCCEIHFNGLVLPAVD